MAQILQKTVTYSDDIDYFAQHLNIINPVLPKKMRLTPREIEVLAVFMSFEGEVAELDRFCTPLRKIALQKLKGMTGPGLSNYIGSLEEKGAIYRTLGSIKILERLIPEKEQQFYQFKLIKNGSN